MRFAGDSRSHRSRLIPLVFALSLVLSLPWALAGCGCPAALLSGELVAQGEELGVDVGANQVERVKWPFGYGVRRDGAILVLTNIMGSVEAREGDQVELGGGEAGDGVFGVCGQIVVHRATSRGTLTARRES